VCPQNMKDCAKARALCSVSPWLAATRNNSLEARVVVVDSWAHVGIGHSMRFSAIMLRLLIDEAAAGGTPRSIRFASCVPDHALGAFSEPDHEVPACGSLVVDPETHLNVSRTAFDAHEHLTFAGIEHLQADAATDFPSSELARSVSCVDGGACRVRPPESCAKLRHRLRVARPRVVYLFGAALRAMALDKCVRGGVAGKRGGAGAHSPARLYCKALSCLGHVELRPSGVPTPRLPPCDVGLHLRSMQLDDHNCDLLAGTRGQAVQPVGGSDGGGGVAEQCAFTWRAHRCKEQSLEAIATGCPGEHRFATSDNPAVYRSYTRGLQWSDLDETASVTWNEGRHVPYPAKLGDVRATAAAFVTLARCQRAIVAPIISHFSETAAIAAGVPLVGCCSMLRDGQHT